MREIPFAARDNAFRRLQQVANYASLSPEERAQYDADEKQFWILYNIEQSRYEEGEQAGILKERKESFQNMISFGVAPEQIAAKYNMTVDEVNKIINSDHL